MIIDLVSGNFEPFTPKNIRQFTSLLAEDHAIARTLTPLSSTAKSIYIHSRAITKLRKCSEVNPLF